MAEITASCFKAAASPLRCPLTPYCVENVERQPFRDVSNRQAVGDRSIAAVLASPGWQEFYLQVKTPAFFNTIAPKQTFSLTLSHS